MKKRTTRPTDPLDEEIDFERFGPVRRNAFAGAGERGGPSLASLWAMPELSASAVLLRRGHPGRGKVMKSTGRSIRLPDAIWAEIEAKAKAKRLNVHQAMREALLEWLRDAS